jgi:hypothetical protein
MIKRPKAKLVKPDEVFETGAFAIGRFGKNIVWKSKLTEETHAELQQRLVALYPETVAKIDELVASIAASVARLPPDQLLHRAWWEMASRAVKIESEAEVSTDDAIAYRMLDYIQSVIASVKPADTLAREITDDEWKTLRDNVEKLFGTLNLTYQMCRTARAKAEDAEYNDDVEEFFYKAQIYWCNVRGHRYQGHEEQFLKDVFLPHAEIIEELFGLTAEAFIHELMKVWNALTFGIREVFEEISSFQSDSMAAVEAKISQGHVSPDADIGDLLQEVVTENGWEARRDRVFGRLLGTDLYDIQKLTGLPTKLLDELTWAPGQDMEFFADGEFKGWPLRIWPIFKRPFIRLDNRILCFDLHNLFDHIYRVMQRVIIRLKPDYAGTWNKTQQSLSEDLPFKYLQAILSGAKVYRSVYYRWFAEPGQTTKNWCETDGLLVYDDHLFIVESRGGSFTYTSPASDFPAFIASLKNLVLKPATQGKRFLDYLGSAETVQLFDDKHQLIGELRRGDFRQISICPVTLDPFTEMAAQIQHLRNIGVDVGSHPVWATSIDDLRVYADVFENPLQFLHYVEQRNEAFKSDIIQTDDELDHLGLYLTHNHYSAHAAELKGDSNARINFNGYRINIDKFFLERLHDPNFPCPLNQDEPPRLVEVLKWLAQSNRSGRSRLASYLLDMAGDERIRLSKCIDSELKVQPTRRRPLAYSSAGGDMVGYTMFCYSDSWAPRKAAAALEHAKQSMIVSGQKRRVLIELNYTDSGMLHEVNWSWLELDSIPSSELEALRVKADALRRQRLSSAAATSGKTGRNQPCPCGSGKKYKKCCLP